MKKKKIPKLALTLLLCMALACSKTDEGMPPEDPESNPEIAFLPVVVHIIHNGEAVGEGPNLSEKRILRQIEILNEDFRRKEGTRGFNNHPESADSMIEFVLAKQTVDGKSSNGINRIDATKVTVPDIGYSQNHYAQYDYWPPDQYINIWVTPLPEGVMCLSLGISSGPNTDLPGNDLLAVPGPNDAEGMLINWMHFGESEIDCHARYGRTVTHEMGHYLGLLHPWAGNNCEFNDFCDDTPAVDRVVHGDTSFMGCQGEMVMIENYMNWSEDDVMNVFTKDQIARMHYVLENDPGRNSLLTSKGLQPLQNL